jgi:ubiquinone/menaquinone biosynthesis C-methylase UbiE
MIELLYLRRGDAVLDAGCGIGTDRTNIVRMVGSVGRAVGADMSETLPAEANPGFETERRILLI